MRIRGKKLMAIMLSAVLTLSIVPFIGTSSVVQAAEEKTVESLGTGVMAPPIQTTARYTKWRGSFVYYGKYDGEPVKYHVLAPSTDIFGGTSMLLDCDSILYEADFYRTINGVKNATDEWDNSDIKFGLNDKEFLNKYGVFTDIEKDSIMNSYRDSHKLKYGVGGGKVTNEVENIYKDYVPLTGEKIFLLDMEDIVNTSYGYTKNDNEVLNRVKKYEGKAADWWSRSKAYKSYTDPFVGAVSKSGNHTAKYVVNSVSGVSPAFNVSLESVIFTSLVSGTAGTDDAEYKLTLSDSNLKTDVNSEKKVTFDGNAVTVPYTISGSDSGNVTQLSVLILDKEYTAGNTNEANIKYYGRLSTADSIGTSGEGTFTFPSKLSIFKWGIDYQVYILAEDVNGEKETDYASEPVKIDKPDNLGVTGDCNWNFDDSTGTLTISGNGKMGDYELFSSPWYDFALYIKNIVIEDGVTHIGDNAFSPTYISGISIPDSVESIGKNAFFWSSNLENVDLGNGVKTIGEGAFHCSSTKTGCKLTSLIIPPGVTSIADNSIGYAFTLSGVEKIDDFTIIGQCNSEAQKYAEKNGFTWISNAHSLTKVPAVSATDSTDGNKEYYACSCGKWFEDAAGTKEIIEHSSVVISKLKTTPTPTPTPSGDDKPITPTPTPGGDDKTTTVEGVGTFSADGTILTDTDGTKYQVSEKMTEDKLVKNAKIADKKSGGKYKITKVTKKNRKVTGGTVTYMKPYNKNCTLISVPNKVKLAGVTFTVTAIAPNCAKGCKKLTKVVIGANVKSIGKNAFYGCKKLKTITIKTTKLTKKTVGANSFKNIHAQAKAKVPKKKLKAYKTILKARGMKGKKQKITK